MKTRAVAFLGVVAIAAATIGIGVAISQDTRSGTTNPRSREAAVEDTAQKILAQGRKTFRSDTFGDEAFWGDTLRLHEAIAGAANGGVGPGLSPEAALELGLKVDVAALPPPLQAALRKGRVDLKSPATTLVLLRLDAVVGVRGFFDESGQQLRSVGITCALCHSDVDDSFASGIGERLDGWAARDLDVGSIIAFAPNLQPFVDLLAIVHPGITADDVRTVLHSWGPGKFDAELILDGKTTGPEGAAATLIPPAFGLAGVNLHTWTGWGSVTHWNAFVANLEMQGQGTFFDPRLKDAAKFPIAAVAGFDDVRDRPDRITPKLAALHFYQLALTAPRPVEGSFNAASAARGKSLFSGRAQCARCHVPPLFTEPGWNMHTPEEIGIDSFQADRSPDERYRTAPLKGLWTHTKGGFYHDGRFAELADVLDHYDAHFALGLSAQDKADLAEYLKSI
jgi:hypothetical protein